MALRGGVLKAACEILSVANSTCKDWSWSYQTSRALEKVVDPTGKEVLYCRVLSAASELAPRRLEMVYRMSSGSGCFVQIALGVLNEKCVYVLPLSGCFSQPVIPFRSPSFSLHSGQLHCIRCKVSWIKIPLLFSRLEALASYFFLQGVQVARNVCLMFSLNARGQPLSASGTLHVVVTGRH
jgi:hypothetical protein